MGQFSSINVGVVPSLKRISQTANCSLEWVPCWFFLHFVAILPPTNRRSPTGPRVCHWKTGTTSLFCLSKNANPRFDTQSCLNLLDINAIPTAYFQKVVQTFHHISTKTSLLAQRVYQVVQLMLTPGRFDDVPFRDNFQVSFRLYNHVYPDDSPVLC